MTKAPIDKTFSDENLADEPLDRGTIARLPITLGTFRPNG